MTRGKRAALIGAPVIAVAIAIAGVFAVPSQPPENIKEAEDCTAVSGGVNSMILSISDGADERLAASVLVDEYCKRTQLVSELSVMNAPATGLVAYGCDAGSGRIGDRKLQQALADYATIYCDSAFVAIFELLEFLPLSIDDFRQMLEQEGEVDSEGDGTSQNATSTANMEEIEAKLQEIEDLANRAKSLLLSDKFYEAAKAYDSASKMLDQLAREF